MSDSSMAYAIDAAEGVSVQLDDSSEDETFSLSVVKDGAEVESHTGVTAASLADLASEYFTATVVDAPAADDSDDVEYDEDAEGGEESEGVERDEGGEVESE